jgi:hypothetical protein
MVSPRSQLCHIYMEADEYRSPLYLFYNIRIILLLHIIYALHIYFTIIRSSRYPITVAANDIQGQETWIDSW